MQKLLIPTLIFLLITSNLLMIEAASAQSNSAPSVPEFTLRLVRTHYVEVTIKNQPFTPYYGDITNISLHYNIQVKGHSTDDWIDLYHSYTQSFYPLSLATCTSYNYPIQSNSEYTTLPVDVKYLDDDMADFRVQAIIAKITAKAIRFSIPGFPDLRYRSPDDCTREIDWTIVPSSWSNTQTINLIDDSVSDSTSPNPTAQTTLTDTLDNQPEANDYTSPSIPLATFLAVTAGFIGIIAVLLMLLFQKHKKPLT